MLREEARVWSVKFPAAPESTNAVETDAGSREAGAGGKFNITKNDTTQEQCIDMKHRNNTAWGKNLMECQIKGR